MPLVNGLSLVLPGTVYAVDVVLMSNKLPSHARTAREPEPALAAMAHAATPMVVAATFAVALVTADIATGAVCAGTGSRPSDSHPQPVAVRRRIIKLLKSGDRSTALHASSTIHDLSCRAREPTARPVMQQKPRSDIPYQLLHRGS